MRTRNFLHSIKHAIQGVAYVFRNEQNFRIQLVVSVLASMSSVLLPLKGSERIVVMLLIIFILVLELVNSAIEKFTDIVKPRLHDQVGVVKDIMAATVLISSAGAAMLGIIIFYPYVIELFAL